MAKHSSKKGNTNIRDQEMMVEESMKYIACHLRIDWEEESELESHHGKYQGIKSYAVLLYVLRTSYVRNISTT